MAIVTSQGGTASPGPSASAGYVTWIKVVAGASGAVASLFAIFTASAAGNIKLGLYSDNAGPDALLAGSGAVNSPPPGTVAFQLGVSVAVSDNVPYWIGIVCDVAMPIGGDAKLFAYLSRSYADGFPASAAGYSTYSGTTATGVGMSIDTATSTATSTGRASQAALDAAGSNPGVAARFGQAALDAAGSNPGVAARFGQASLEVAGRAPPAASAAPAPSVFIMA